MGKAGSKPKGEKGARKGKGAKHRKAGGGGSGGDDAAAASSSASSNGDPVSSGRSGAGEDGNDDGDEGGWGDQTLFSRNKQKVTKEDFELLTVVGKGSFGKVMQVRKKDDGKIYAMKVSPTSVVFEYGWCGVVCLSIDRSVFRPHAILYPRLCLWCVLSGCLFVSAYGYLALGRTAGQSLGLCMCAVYVR
jgi:hypothetical protein